MGRGPESQETKLKKLMAKASDIFEMEVSLPDETIEDKMREAQSVINYFECKGKGFTKAVCEVCNLQFAYSYPYTGVKCCSVKCMSSKLKSMGLQWDPNREPDRRWGRFVPAIVPPSALEIVTQFLDDTLKD